MPGEIKVRVKSTGQVIDMAPAAALAMINGGTAERVEETAATASAPVVVGAEPAANEAAVPETAAAAPAENKAVAPAHKAAPRKHPKKHR